MINEEPIAWVYRLIGAHRPQALNRSGDHHRRYAEVYGTVADTRRLPGPRADIWDWQLRGSCRGMASSYFFHPEGERGPARARREDQAKAICVACPVLAACREHAMQVHEPYGIWGGMTEGERAQRLSLDVRAG